MWAALTDPGRSSGRWAAEDFLATGRAEIGSVLALLARRGATPRTGTALDFGCGPGRLTAALAEAGFDRVVGVDVSPTMLDAARELVTTRGCEFLLNEGDDLAAVPTGSIDLVYCCRVLQHMPSSLAHGYIGEFLRVAAPGAPVVFQLPSQPAPGAVGLALRCVPQSLLTRLRRGMQMHGTGSAEVVRLIADAGGSTVSVEEDHSAGPRWVSHLYIARSGG